MLLANPGIEELYHKSCALAEDSQELRDSFQHPARLIKVCRTLSVLVRYTRLTVMLWSYSIAEYSQCGRNQTDVGSLVFFFFFWIWILKGMNI